MAHVLPLDVQCTERGCTKRATVVVRDHRNNEIRKCCRKHGDALADQLTKEGR